MLDHTNCRYAAMQKNELKLVLVDYYLRFRIDDVSDSNFY
jgi:hypothetical protein